MEYNGGGGAPGAGEELSELELGHMIAEAKMWAQEPPETVERRSGRTGSLGGAAIRSLVDKMGEADGGHASKQLFAPSPRLEKVDLSDPESFINEAEFACMLTQYWTCRKYGKQGSAAVNQQLFDVVKRQDKLMNEQEQLEVLDMPDRTASRDNILPTPVWMADIASEHVRIAESKRAPQFFWYYLTRKMEELLRLKENSLVDDAGVFRRSDDMPKKFVGGPCVRNTSSRFSAVWDLIQVLLLAYVSLTVPYQTGFDITNDLYSVGWWLELFIDVYFIIDIGFNFRTPYVGKQGRLVVSGRAMAVNYLKGWALIDIGSCASVLQYFLLMFGSEDSGGASNARAAKVLRLLRLAKLLRLARMKRLVDRMGDEIIQVLAPLGSLFFLLLGTAFAMHLISCFWYLAGSGEDDERQIICNFDGTGCDATPAKGWVASTFGDNIKNISITTRYLTSLYGIMLGEFQVKTTNSEKSFALVSVLVNGFIYGAVAATLSSIMMMLKAPHAEYNAKMDALKTWMRSKKLDYGIRTQVEAFYEAKLSTSARVVVNEGAIISELHPAPMAIELVQILYAPIIERVPIFSKLEEEVIAQLCLALTPIPALKGSPVAIQGRSGDEMYIIMKGKLQVWEDTAKSVTRAKCVHNGLTFWATVFEPKLFKEGVLDLRVSLS
jgi:hypothetical protein